jgi:hypothetical protein
VTPPTRHSRHRFCLGVSDEAGRSYLTDRVPFGYRDLPDNLEHVVQEGDTLWGLAGVYYDGVERASGLWWVIADFQPDPIVDPTVALVPGTILVVPSLATVQARVLVEARRTSAKEQEA